MRRDTGDTYQAFLTGLATASGIETPTRADLARLDRTEEEDIQQGLAPSRDPDAKVAKMKDGRTHLAHKAEHAVDLDTGAIVAVTLQGADQGDTTTIVETVLAATEQVEAAQIGVDDPQSLDEIIADKGYHSNQTMVDLERRRHPVLHRRARSRSPGLVEGARGPGPGLSAIVAGFEAPGDVG